MHLPEVSKRKNSEKVDISKVFEKFGKYQLVQYFFTCIPALFINLININYIFVAGDLNYRCQVPECETAPHIQHPTWWPSDSIDRCLGPVLNSSHQVCTNESFTGVLETCTSWVYETNRTVIADLNLACQPWKINLIGTIHNLGTMTSMLIAGWMTDRFGRKPTMIICGVLACVGHIKAFVSNYYLYILVEYMESTFGGGVNAAAMVSMIEIAGIKHRVLVGILFAYAVYLGEFLFAILAMYVEYWKNLVRIIYSPPLFFITYIFLIKESPRWQILKEKTEDAKETLRLIAKMNNIDIDSEELDAMDAVTLKAKFNMIGSKESDGIVKIFKSKEIMKRLLVSLTCRFSASFVYYGLMVNSVWLPGNKYVNFMLATLMSFPGELVALYLMNKIGRKKPLIVGFIISGILCIITAYIPQDLTWLIITLFLFSKMIIALCFTGAVTYIMELFPTSTRGTLLGFGSFASRVGGMLAPLTPILMTVSPILPSLFFGASALLSGCLLTLTPETKGMPLLDTIDQINESSVRTKKNVERKG